MNKLCRLLNWISECMWQERNKEPMATISISNRQFLNIIDECTNIIYCGCNQEWYGTKWQRLAGCGPSVASNIFGYLYKLHDRSATRKEPYPKRDFLVLMEEVWHHVTPTVRGVNTTGIFYNGLISYAQTKGLDLKYRFIDVSAEQRKRPALSEITTFIEEGLCKDTPVAFLNLCNGKEKKLDKWHWVTVVSMTYADDPDKITLEICDEGLVQKIDLKLWYDTTTIGGGFVFATI